MHISSSIPGGPLKLMNISEKIKEENGVVEAVRLIKEVMENYIQIYFA